MSTYIRILLSIIWFLALSSPIYALDFMYAAANGGNVYSGPVYLSSGSISTGSLYLNVSLDQRYFFDSNWDVLYWTTSVPIQVLKKSRQTWDVSLVCNLNTASYFNGINSNYIFTYEYVGWTYILNRFSRSNCTQITIDSWATWFTQFTFTDSGDMYYYEWYNIFKYTTSWEVVDLWINAGSNNTLSVSKDWVYLYYLSSTNWLTQRKLSDWTEKYISGTSAFYSDVDSNWDFYYYNGSNQDIYFVSKNTFTTPIKVFDFDYNTWHPLEFRIYDSSPGNSYVEGYIDWLTCQTLTLPDIENTLWNDFWSLSNTWSSNFWITWTGRNILWWEDTDGTTNNIDRFGAFDYESGSTLPHGAIEYPWSATGNLYYSTGPNWEQASLYFSSIRNGERYGYNIAQFYGIRNQTLYWWWAYSTEWNSEQTPFYASWGIATIVLNNRYDFKGRVVAVSGFNWFRMWVSPTVSKVQCSWSNWNYCEWGTAGNELVCEWRQEGGYISWNCGINSNGYCVPLLNSSWAIVPPNPIPWQTQVLDGSGNVVNTWYYTPYSNVYVDDIFSCPNYQDWTDTPACVIQIFKNAFNVVKNSIYSVSTWSENTIQGAIKNIWSSSWSIDFGPVSPTGINLADSMYRGTWNSAFDETNIFSSFWRFALYGAMFVVILAIFLVVILINRKN